MTRAALGYAAADIPVFPCYSVVPQQLEGGAAMVCTCGDLDCASPGKHPVLRHGVKEATSDVDRVVAWWAQHPGANIGIATGIAFDVLDLDGPEGVAAMREFVAEHGLDLAQAPVVRTGSGGFHYLLAPSGGGNRVHFLPHVDWRGLGGYVIAPPSRHASGRRYEWIVGRTLPQDGRLPVVPDPLLEKVRRHAPEVDLSIVRFTPDDTQHPYGRTALVGELDKIRSAPEGARNYTLNVGACKLFSLVAGGVLDEGEVRRGLQSAALEAGLTPREIGATVESAYRYGTQRPRGIPDRPFARATVPMQPEPELEIAP
jgi:Bifunctional DNA primase/polymerase, N-terminal